MDNALREMIRTFGLVERVMEPYFAQFGISGAQWGVLRNLHRAEQEGRPNLRLGELSERLLIRPPSVTGLIDRLERAELVTRQASPTDQRARQIQLSAAGRQLVRRILVHHDAQVNKVLAGLDTAEQAELSRLLAAWGRHLNELLETSTALVANAQ
jgi:DNA-binding MarR family transcriptional regulator